MVTKRTAIIVDLDGTLCSVEWRRHFVTEGKKDWKAFFDGIPCDAPNPQVVEIIRDAKERGYDVIITSARPERWGTHSAIWLAEHGIDYDAFFIRKDGDFRDDGVVKREIYEEHIAPFWEVLFAVDDRPVVLETWRSLGLTVLEITDPALDPIMEGPQW